MEGSHSLQAANFLDHKTRQNTKKVEKEAGSHDNNLHVSLEKLTRNGVILFLAVFSEQIIFYVAAATLHLNRPRLRRRLLWELAS